MIFKQEVLLFWLWKSWENLFGSILFYHYYFYKQCLSMKSRVAYFGVRMPWILRKSTLRILGHACLLICEIYHWHGNIGFYSRVSLCIDLNGACLISIFWNLKFMGRGNCKPTPLTQGGKMWTTKTKITLKLPSITLTQCRSNTRYSIYPSWYP